MGRTYVFHEQKNDYNWGDTSTHENKTWLLWYEKDIMFRPNEEKGCSSGSEEHKVPRPTIRK